MNTRIAAVQRALKGSSYLFTAAADLFYLTGISLDGFWLVVTPRGATAITSQMTADHLRSLLHGIPVVVATSFSDGLFSVCKSQHIRSLGVDPDATSVAIFEKLKSKIALRSCGSPLTTIKLYKYSNEIAAIRQACSIAVAAYRYARTQCKPGVTENDIYYKIESFYAKNKVKASFPTIVAFGPHAANPHHVPGARKLRKNDTVLLDLGCVVRGYCSDLTRTFFLGTITGLQTRVFSSVKRAQLAALKAVRAGASARTIDAAARDLIAQDGYGSHFIHTTGHGVGIQVHEAPRLSATDTTILKAGMVVTVEPGIYLPGKFGVRIEDTVLVTTNGCEILTKETHR